MIPAMIATAVAPETITKVTRLFNNTAYDVICELFQNARRAGATIVAVTVITASDATYLQVVDDGHGIADPASIVTLGRSGWSDDTRRAEDPAGMGVFSLAGRDVIIRSYSRPDRQGWMAHIPASAWETSRPIAISSDPIPYGTSLTVRMPEQWLTTIERDVATAARYFPVPVTFNGEPQEQHDWLADAVHVETWKGTRIGIRRVPASHYSSRDAALNFHGVTIPCRLPHLTEVDRGDHWIARVDIVNAPDIQLVLPARKEVVENEGVSDLRTAVQCTLYRAIAAQGTHRLSFENWTEARDLGVLLSEAEPYLFTWAAPAADQYRNYETGVRTTDPAMVLMPDQEALVAIPAERAITKHNPFGGPLVDATPGVVAVVLLALGRLVSDVHEARASQHPFRQRVGTHLRRAHEPKRADERPQLPRDEPHALRLLARSRRPGDLLHVLPDSQHDRSHRLAGAATPLSRARARHLGVPGVHRLQ